MMRTTHIAVMANTTLGLLIAAEIKHSKPWRIELAISNIPVKYKIDSGADVITSPKSIYRRMDLPALVVARKMLHGPCHHPLRVTRK